MQDAVEMIFPGFLNNQSSYYISEVSSTIIKVGVLFGLLVYMGFSILIVRQAQLMTRTVAGELDRLVNALSWGHFALGALVFLLVLLFL
jgi:hypothetical protein